MRRLIPFLFMWYCLIQFTTMTSVGTETRTVVLVPFTQKTDCENIKKNVKLYRSTDVVTPCWEVVMDVVDRTQPLGNQPCLPNLSDA